MQLKNQHEILPDADLEGVKRHARRSLVSNIHWEISKWRTRPKHIAVLFLQAYTFLGIRLLSERQSEVASLSIRFRLSFSALSAENSEFWFFRIPSRAFFPPATRCTYPLLVLTKFSLLRSNWLKEPLVSCLHLRLNIRNNGSATFAKRRPLW